MVGQKWRASNRCERIFLKKNIWLNEKCIEINTVLSSKKKNSLGRSVKNFSESCGKSKSKKIKHLIETVSPEELAFATQKSFRQTGKKTMADMVKYVTESSTKDVLQLKKSDKEPVKEPIPYTSDEALSMIIENKLTKNLFIFTKRGQKQASEHISILSSNFGGQRSMLSAKRHD